MVNPTDPSKIPFKALVVEDDPYPYGDPNSSYLTPCLAHVLPWSVRDILDVFRGIPYERDHIDQDSHEVLNKILTLIKTIKSQYEPQLQIDQEILKGLIPLLKTIELEQEPIKIFYPQIHARKPTSTDPTRKKDEEVRIATAKTEASEKAVSYQLQARSLLDLVSKKVQPGGGSEDNKIIEKLEDFETLCQNASEEQKGLVAKIISFVSRKLMESIDQMRDLYLKKGGDSKNKEEVVGGNHPLAELLVLLSNTTYTLSDNLNTKIKDALPRLEYHDSFKGIQHFIEKRVPEPHKNLRGFRKALHHFLMKRFIPKMNPSEYLDDAYLHVYSSVCRLVKKPLPNHPVSEKEEFDWIIEEIHATDQLTQQAIKLVQNSLTHDQELIALCEAALREKVSLTEPPPPLSASDADKIAWTIKFKDIKTVQEKCSKATEKVQSSEKKLHASPIGAIPHREKIEDKITWAKKHLKSLWGQQFMRQGGEREHQLRDLVTAGAKINIIHGLDETSPIHEIEKWVEELDLKMDPDKQWFVEEVRRVQRLALNEATSLASELEKQVVVREKQLQAISKKIQTNNNNNSSNEDWLKDINLKKYSQDRDLVRMVMRARGEVKTPYETDLDFLDFYQRAKEKNLKDYPDPQCQTGHKILWAKRVVDGEIPCDDLELNKLLKEIREDLHDQFIAILIYVQGKLRRDPSLPKSIEELNQDLLSFYHNAKVSQTKLSEIKEDQLRVKLITTLLLDINDWDEPKIQPLAIKIKKDLENPFIKKYLLEDGTLTCDHSTPKIEWGQAELKKCFAALFEPGDSSMQKSAELVWMATAHYQQLQELDRIRIQVTKEEGSPSVEMILQNLNLVIQALEGQSNLMGTEKIKELTKQIVEPTLDWINISHEFCRQEQQNSIQQKEIDELFEPITLDIRKGEYLSAFKKLKALLEKSPGATRKLIEHTNLENLNDLENAFSIFLEKNPPQKTSEVQKKILEALKSPPETPMTKEILTQGIELQRSKMVSNVLVLAGYKLLNLIFKGGGLHQSYKKYREAVDTIAGRTEDYDPTRIKDAATTLLEESGYSLETEEGKALIERFKASIQSTKDRFEGQLETLKAKRALHQKTYEGVLSVLIAANAKGHELQCHVARGFIPILLWVIHLFIDPFSTTLIKRFTEDVILESNGQLTTAHTKPISALNDAFSTYNEKVNVWPEITRENALESSTVAKAFHGVKGGERQKNLEKMLNTSRTYPHGLTPSQIDQKGLYLCVDEYLQVAHYCQDVQGLFDQISEKLWARSHHNPILNSLAFGIKGVLSLLPYTYAWGYFLVLKISEVLINFSLQQAAKFAIWYTQAGTNILMQALNTTVKSSSYTTTVDKILLQILKDVEKNLEKELKLAKKETKGAVSVNDSPIKSLYSNILRSLIIIQCDTVDNVRGLDNDLIAKAILQLDIPEIKAVVVPLITKTLESFLNDESMLIALYNGLELANKGVREETDPLTPDQMEELKRKMKRENKEPAETDILKKVEEIHHGLTSEMAKTIKKIIATAAHPQIDKAIDDLAKQPGQIVSETISWLEKVLYDDSTKEDSECILHKLTANFDHLNHEEHRDLALNKMYQDFSQFIKVFREYRDNLERYQSYNGILLSRDVLDVIAKPLDELTMALAQVMQAPRDDKMREHLRQKLRAMQGATKSNRPKLNQVKDSEATSHAERHRGVLGRTLGSWEVLISILKDKIKPMVHTTVDTAAEHLATRGRAILKDSVLMRHLLESVAAEYLKV